MHRAAVLGPVALTLTLAGPTAAATKYPAGARHSPMSAEVVTHLRGIVERGKERGLRPDVFAKIGDSITITPKFLSCFADPTQTDLGSRTDLADTLSFFGRTHADDDHSSWNRKPRSAGSGWSTFGVLGHPKHSPLKLEVARIKPAFAVVMLGTNETYGGGLANYQRNLGRVIREILAESVVPIVSTIPPRRDNPQLDALTLEMNVIVRELAEAEQIPYVDLASELRKLPAFGLIWDGIHPGAHGGRPCDLDTEHLEGGMNVRNLMTLEALDRVRRFVLAGERAEELRRGGPCQGSRGRALADRARLGLRARSVNPRRHRASLSPRSIGTSVAWHGCVRCLRILAFTVLFAASAGCAGAPEPRTARPSGPRMSLVVGVDQSPEGATTFQLTSYRLCREEAPPKRKTEPPVRVSVGLAPKGRTATLIVLAIVAAAVVAAVVSTKAEDEASQAPIACQPEPAQPRVARVRSGGHDVIVPVDPSGRATVPFALEQGWTVVVDGAPAAPAYPMRRGL